VLKGAAEFCLDWAIEDPKTKCLVTAPSTSPENAYLMPNGQYCQVSMGTACDLSLMWEVFRMTIEASRILGVDEALRAQMEQAQKRLSPLKIGSKGQILEFHDEFPEPDTTSTMLYGMQHRHASHLVGLCWGTRITKRGTPELFEAAHKSFVMRGRGGGLPEKLAMAARLEDPDLVWQTIPSALFDGNRPLSMIEFLVQSHLRELHLLPALPAALPEGHLRGVKARGGYLLDLEWKEGKLAKSVIRSKFAGKCRVRTSVPVVVTAAGKPVKTASPEASVVEFDTTAGGVYTLTRKA
jgi:alpha-L-fucosidase 2